MQLIRGIHELQPRHRPTVASIGNYDGVHLGHQHVIKTLLQRSAELKLPATVITFKPLAKAFFQPGSVALLSSIEQRAKQLFELGVDQVLCIDFNAEFAAYSPSKFVTDVLLKGLDVKYLCVGDDFRFGKDRAGDFAFLQRFARQHAFSVAAHHTFSVGGVRVSSGRVRDALMQADFALAEALLGRPYSIFGKVSRGRQLGRTLNFPTANIALDPAQTALNGVYVVSVTGSSELPTAADGSIKGVANVGTRPTVGGSENRIEVHLFDFDADLYGQTLGVRFLKKIRGEQKFASINELKAQIAVDADAARSYLQNCITRSQPDPMNE